jgi:hypothetical protein
MLEDVMKLIRVPRRDLRMLDRIMTLLRRSVHGFPAREVGVQQRPRLQYPTSIASQCYSHSRAVRRQLVEERGSARMEMPVDVASGRPDSQFVQHTK